MGQGNRSQEGKPIFYVASNKHEDYKISEALSYLAGIVQHPVLRFSISRKGKLNFVGN